MQDSWIAEVVHAETVQALKGVPRICRRGLTRLRLRTDNSPVRLLLFVAILLPVLPAADWSRFRGPNGTGVAEAARLPSDFGPDKKVVWKVTLPEGHSSPVFAGDRIFLTGAEGGKRADAGREKVVDQGGRLYTLCVDRRTGKELWRREVPRPRLERYQPTNSAASPSPATDGKSVFVFFGDYGVMAYDLNGKERWRYRMGPFNNVNGHGSSPVVFEDAVIMLADQDSNSYLVSLDKATGRVKGKVVRPEATRS